LPPSPVARRFAMLSGECFWCNGHMHERGITKIGAGINHITYFCIDCGGIAHFAIDTEHDSKIKSFEIKYNRSKDE
jgi:hypothetical protein